MKKVLVVDDKPNNLSLVTSLLRPFYEVLLANHGEKAIQTAKEKKPDLILLDIMMPGMSGFEVCEVLKSDPMTAPIPVIFLTAKNDGEDFEKAYGSGGVDYATKPINAKELLMRVKTHLLIQDQQNSLIELNKRISSINENLESELNRRASDLFKALEKLENQNTDLLRFSHIVSHNLRGPVASVLGLLALFNQNNPTDPVNGEVVRRLKDSVVGIDVILKDVSSILELREAPIEAPTVFSLLELITDVLHPFKEQIESGQLKVTTNISLSDIKTVKSYVESIFAELILNAWKYRSLERILEVNIEAFIQDKFIRMDIQDNGNGFDASDSWKIFEPYKKLQYNSSGRGIGLYLVQTRINSLGGTITASGRPGLGASFSILLPIA